MIEFNLMNRWWENYLVRYLMPSIAGIAIVSWLSYVAEPGFIKVLFFGLGEQVRSGSGLAMTHD